MTYPLLEWHDKEPTHEGFWQRASDAWAQSSGDMYTIRKTPTIQLTMEDGSTRSDPDRYEASWIPAGDPNDWDSVTSPEHVHTGDRVDVLKEMCEQHHQRVQRRKAWARYMRENDPPLTATKITS